MILRLREPGCGAETWENRTKLPIHAGPHHRAWRAPAQSEEYRCRDSAEHPHGDHRAERLRQISLAFDTIYAEGQRRYVETLSPYARQFLDQMERPEVDSIDGLSPAISIEQKTTSRSPRSTVGTITEIYDYLRRALLVDRHSALPDLRHRDLAAEHGTDPAAGARAPHRRARHDPRPVVRGRKGEYKKDLEKLAAAGIRARADRRRAAVARRRDHARQAHRTTRSKWLWTGC